MFVKPNSPIFHIANEKLPDLCTSGLYWSMIESGFGVCGACLPAQYGLFNTKGFQSIVWSVQSAISLRSFRSATQQNESGYLGSKTERLNSEEQGISTTAEGPTKGDSGLELGMKDGIVVTNSFGSHQ